jgi:WD40 repeat protein
VVCTGNDGTISRFDGRTGAPLGRVLGHRGMIRALRAGPEPNQFMTGAADQLVRVWDARDGSLVGEAIGSEREVLAVGFDEVAKALVSVGSDGKFRAWDLAAQVLDPVFREHRAWVYGVAFDAKGRVVSTGGEFPAEDGRVLVWDPRTRAVVESTPRALGAKATIAVDPAIDPRGGVLATFWDGSTSAQGGVAFLGQGATRSFRIEGTPPYSSVFLHDGAVLAIRRFNVDAVEFYDRSGTRLASFPISRGGFAPPLIASPGGRSVWTADAEGLVQISLDVAPGALAELARREASTAPASPDAPPIAVDAKILRHIRFEVGSAVRTISIDARGRAIAVGTEDGCAVLFDRSRDAEWTLRWTRRIHENASTRVALSPDGARLATAGGDVGIRIWDTATGEPLLFLVGHGDEVIDLAFSSDGHLLASGSIDRTVRVWDGRPLESRALKRDAWSGVPEPEE